MTLWDYDGDIVERAKMLERLKERGKQGWELVSAYPREPARPSLLQLVFKSKRVYRALTFLLSSWEPSSEQKSATVGFALSKWCEPTRSAQDQAKGSHNAAD